MLKDLVSINIEGASFTTPTELPLFNPHDGNNIKTIKGTLLYGRNGSGKSTIAKGFRVLKGEQELVGLKAICKDVNGSTIGLSEGEKDRIFIFDEDFVNKNVKLQNDHLDTIIMLGKQVDLTEKLKEAEIEKAKATDEYEKQKNLVDKYNDRTDVNSPKFYLDEILNKLKGDNNWAGRDKIIKEGRQNTRVAEDTYQQFMELRPKESKSELLINFENKMQELMRAKSGISVISATVPILSQKYISYDDQEVANLLAKKIEKPALSERERYLFNLIQDEGSAKMTERVNVFRKEDTSFCPYCLQDIAPNYKADLVKSIEKVLSKEVEQHQGLLEKKKIGVLSFDFSEFKELEGYEHCLELMEKINQSVEKANTLIDQKKNNPYSPITNETIDIGVCSKKLEKALVELADQKRVHNEKSKSTAPIARELNRINAEIAYYDIELSVKHLEKQQEEKRLVEKCFHDRDEQLKEIKKVVDGLEAQRKNIHLAINEINKCLKYIFFSEDRLEIKCIDGTYKLFCAGKNVKPCDVSVGERNIIGLSYFFTHILNNQDANVAYGKEYLLILDDPVSSYDRENRIGILSFLKYKLGLFLEGNMNTKVLVMSHDLMTYYDLHKVFEELIKSCNNKGYPNKLKFNGYELKNCSIEAFLYNNRHEYTQLMENVFNYAVGQSEPQYEIVIGNMIRQVLEAFSTFEYKKAIDKVSTDKAIILSFADERYGVYFENLMYRLVLHGGSHKEERVKSMDDLNFFSLISEDEKRRTAKDVLCFIYLLNKSHSLAHLRDIKDQDVENTLDTWCENILKHVSVPDREIV
jgi:hypothetical protein